MPKSQTFLGITGTHLGESAKAVKFQINDISGEPVDPPQTTWFPFSQVQRITMSATEVGKDCLVVSEWILKEKGLI